MNTTTEKQLMLNNVLGELMIRKSLIEPFDKERAEMYEEEIYKLKQLLNEKNKPNGTKSGYRTFQKHYSPSLKKMLEIMSVHNANKLFIY